MTSCGDEQLSDRRFAIVVFCPADGFWRRLVRWHVWAAVNDGVVWIYVDPMRGRPVIRAVDCAKWPLAVDGVAFVVPLKGGSGLFPMPLIGSCVSIVKWICGIKAPWVWTPEQFRCYMLTRFEIHGGHVDARSLSRPAAASDD